MRTPFVVGLGGTVRASSTSETALRTALQGAEEAGAQTALFAAHDLELPFYDPKAPHRAPAALRLVEALRSADGVIVASPGYHGAISGLIKNALDYTEDLVGDDRVYLDGLPFGCIGVAYGAQAAVSVLANLRGIAHALRAFPTPYGAAIVAGPGVFSQGSCLDRDTAERLALVGRQVVEMAGVHTWAAPALVASS